MKPHSDSPLLNIFNECNRRLWDELAERHRSLGGYGTGELIEGGTTLGELERQRLGFLKGKRVLHLQCHFGLDTLSLARMGATVTGVDFSPRAIQLARNLAAEIGGSAQFFCCDVYDLDTLDLQPFDVILASHGIIEWLYDLGLWAKVLYRHLKGAGRLLLFDSHPLVRAMVQCEDASGKSIGLAGDYFSSEWAEPCVFNTSYADRSMQIEPLLGFRWRHTLTDLIGSLLNAGLDITAFEEFPFLHYKKFDSMRSDGKGSWTLPDVISVPLALHIEAIRR